MLFHFCTKSTKVPWQRLFAEHALESIHYDWDNIWTGYKYRRSLEHDDHDSQLKKCGVTQGGSRQMGMPKSFYGGGGVGVGIGPKNSGRGTRSNIISKWRK